MTGDVEGMIESSGEYSDAVSGVTTRLFSLPASKNGEHFPYFLKSIVLTLFSKATLSFLQPSHLNFTATSKFSFTRTSLFRSLQLRLFKSWHRISIFSDINIRPFLLYRPTL